MRKSRSIPLYCRELPATRPSNLVVLRTRLVSTGRVFLLASECGGSALRKGDEVAAFGWRVGGIARPFPTFWNDLRLDSTKMWDCCDGGYGLVRGLSRAKLLGTKMIGRMWGRAGESGTVLALEVLK